MCHRARVTASQSLTSLLITRIREVLIITNNTYLWPCRDWERLSSSESSGTPGCDGSVTEGFGLQNSWGQQPGAAPARGLHRARWSERDRSFFGAKRERLCGSTAAGKSPSLVPGTPVALGAGTSRRGALLAAPIATPRPRPSRRFPCPCPHPKNVNPAPWPHPPVIYRKIGRAHV